MATQMERRHFEVIASILHDLRNEKFLSSDQQDELAECFAISLKKTNENFKTDKFLKACGHTMVCVNK